MTGLGEGVAPVAGVPALSLVLVNPGVAVPTPAVFRALTRADNPPLPPVPAFVDAAAVLDWLGATRNDLEAPVARSAVTSLRQAGWI
jgi:4-diphosphocytidyl-2-C-methyl-D-erythritol kinase